MQSSALYAHSHVQFLGAMHTMYMAGRVRPRFKGYRKTFIREYREARGLTLQQLADRLRDNHDLDITHASLSRIERALQPYNQGQLEAIADELGTEPPSLLMRRPDDPEGIWSIWDQAKPGQKRQILEVAKTLIKTGTSD